MTHDNVQNRVYYFGTQSVGRVLLDCYADYGFETVSTNPGEMYDGTC